MGRKIWFALMLGMSAAPLAAQTPSPPIQAPPANPAPAADAVEGLYETRIREVASALMLTPEGRFVFFFSSGALDLYAAGRWTRGADGAVTIDSDPVTPPLLELVSSAHDPQVGAAIRMVCDSGEIQTFLTPIVEYADGALDGHRFDRLQAIVPNEPARTIAAVQVGSGPFDFRSERVPVTPQANVFTFRFTPNDIGRENLDDVRGTLQDGVLTLNWRGEAMPFHRTGTAVGQEMPELPTAPRPVADAAPIALEVAIGEDITQLAARAGAGLAPEGDNQTLTARGPVDLRLAIGEHRIDLGRTAGGRQPLSIYDSYASSTVDGVAYEGGELLALEAALARAQALKAWLEQAGFAVLPGAESMDSPPFSVVGTTDGDPPITDWASAARVLADEQRGVTEMELFTLRTPDHLADVKLVNVRRTEAERCAHSQWSGPEWRLDVRILRSRMPA